MPKLKEVIITAKMTTQVIFIDCSINTSLYGK